MFITSVWVGVTVKSQFIRQKNREKKHSMRTTRIVL